MKAITVRQPWALCIASGHKNVENRGRPTSYRGEIAIHAAKAHDPAGDVDPRVVRLWGVDSRLRAPLGAIIAVGELTDCHQRTVACRIKGHPCWPWGESTYRDGVAWHLVLGNVRRLDVPVHCRGALQVGWTVPGVVEEQVRNALAEQGGGA